MTTPTDYSAVSLQQITRYLVEKGWREVQKIDDKAVVLELAKDSESHAILLPLRSNLSDYNSRMYEVFKSLEPLESRSQIDLFNDFLDPSYIANREQREIINTN